MKKYSNLFKGFISTIVSTIGGFLGSYAGASNTSKQFRRIGIPCIIASMAYGYTQNLWVLTIGLMILVLSIGYGTPSHNDEGSVLGKFWHKITKGNELYTNLLTRGTISILICLSLLSIPIIKNNWNLYKLCSLGIILSYTNFTWRDLGTFKFLKKDLLWSEFIVYFSIVGLSAILIQF